VTYRDDFWTGGYSTWPHSGTGTATTITGLRPGTAYDVQVRALNGDTPSWWSTPRLFATNAPNRVPEFPDERLTRTVAENSVANRNVGAAIPAATDRDLRDVLTYTMEGADAGSFTFDPAARQIKTKNEVSYDYESKFSYSVTIRVWDGTASDTVTVTINLTDLTERPATGAPTITGTAQVGQTLTAGTSGIADEDGLDNATFAYQWQADGADIQDATGSTYTLVAADVGSIIRVRVSFTDDVGNDEVLTSAATAPVEALPLPPLIASLQNTPNSHDGGAAFTFELRFSEEFALSYRTLRDHAFTVTGRTVRKAERLEQGSNIGWKITVQPNGNGQVVIVLPETSDCDAQGAICTGDGRMLSSRLELTVSGPGQ